ncbi:MAG: hypothetical protein U0163_15335 [Gemmatimonadaceae bacterium]
MDRALKGEKPYLNLAFQPAIGAPDTLADALGDWESRAMDGAGEFRSWSVRWRGRVVTESAGGGNGIVGVAISETRGSAVRHEVDLVFLTGA